MSKNLAAAPAKRRQKKPSKEEIQKHITDSLIKMKDTQQEIIDENAKIASLNLKHIPEIVNEALEDVAEDIQEFEEKLKELDAQPEENK